MAGLAWGALAVSMLLMLLGVATRSWLALWGAALLSGFFSTLGVFSVGLYVFLLTALQLAFAFELRSGKPDRDWLRPISLGMAIWGIAAAIQLLTTIALAEVPWGPFVVFPAAIALGTLAIFAAPRFTRDRPEPPTDRTVVQ